jgi:hypothetical protein
VLPQAVEDGFEFLLYPGLDTRLYDTFEVSQAPVYAPHQLLSPSSASALDLGGRRWTMSRLLRVGDKVINLDNIEYIIRDGDGVVRIHFIHGDIELWNEQGEAFRQWVLSNTEYCEGSGEGW